MNTLTIRDISFRMEGLKRKLKVLGYPNPNRLAIELWESNKHSKLKLYAMKIPHLRPQKTQDMWRRRTGDWTLLLLLLIFDPLHLLNVSTSFQH